jgi:hypothetical protein
MIHLHKKPYGDSAVGTSPDRMTCSSQRGSRTTSIRVLNSAHRFSTSSTRNSTTRAETTCTCVSRSSQRGLSTTFTHMLNPAHRFNSNSCRDSTIYAERDVNLGSTQPGEMSAVLGRKTNVVEHARCKLKLGRSASGTSLKSVIRKPSAADAGGSLTAESSI